MQKLLRFHIEPLKLWATATSKQELYSRVSYLLDSNGIDKETKVDTMTALALAVDYQLDQGDGYEPPLPARIRAQFKWSTEDVRRFLKTVAAWGKRSGFAFVPDAEANRRAAICAQCPLNIQVSGCAGCSGLTKFVRLLRRGRSTRFDNQLGHCGACGCDLKTKVLLPLEALNNSPSDDGVAYPSHCWMREAVPEPPEPPATP